MAERHNLTVDECLALLKDASLRPESIAEEMECAGVSRPQPTHVQSARDVLAKLHTEAVAQTAGLAGPDARALAAEIASLPEMLALALVHAAGRVARQEVLLELATSPSRMLAKESKRELQKLKQRGVQVQELPPQGEPVLKPLPEGEAPSCYASSIDAYGERAVWWTRPARQGVELVQIVISDLKGILAVDALALSRRSWREFVKRLPRQNVVATVEIPKDHARQLIAEAEAAGARNGFSPPPAYADALRLLGPAPQTPPPSPGLSLELPDELAHQLAGAALFEDPLFMAWIPEEDDLRRFALRLDEIATSQLYIDAAQRRQALERAADDAALAYFTPQRRALYAKRLVEMAHVLASERRLDAARTALAVSRALGTDATNSFCRALFTHSLQGRLEPKAPPPQPSPSGLVTL
ncbi:MAG: hypothetical protein AUH83_13825 [Deltaproteobacteria bacterium 13_1_40CM_4_68_19]|nr:MAG: hypothetical protein AUH83_13825 [Deltaproteobacteria bacterium 13_1_40CM_4_68_19]OLD10381.1 MAG: hypothetical protein AUI90_01165 [Deltaproteobacteria bacterium 13_1_40CM_3_69_14]OLD45407.1 MAG: hypothetical protein AUI48_12935 [Chloroflexi bacterium 13_1_40CM_2_68_14]